MRYAGLWSGLGSLLGAECGLLSLAAAIQKLDYLLALL